MRINLELTVGVVIDMQERLLPHMEESKKLINRCSMLIRGLKILSVPLLYTEQYPKGLGSTNALIRKELETDRAIEKITFSCYGDHIFAARLSECKRKIVLIAGIETHVCILQTVLDLLNNDYLPVVVKDCTASRNSIDHNTALKRIITEGGIITTAESVLFELMKTAHHPCLKEISRLVK